MGADPGTLVISRLRRILLGRETVALGPNSSSEAIPLNAAKVRVYSTHSIGSTPGGGSTSCTRTTHIEIGDGHSRFRYGLFNFGGRSRNGPNDTARWAIRAGSFGRARSFSWNVPATGNVPRYSATVTSRPVGSSIFRGRLLALTTQSLFCSRQWQYTSKWSP